MKHARSAEELGLTCLSDAFFEAFVRQAGGAAVAGRSVSVLVDSSALWDYPGRDPADRVIVDSALRSGARIVTGDDQMLCYLDYGARF